MSFGVRSISAIIDRGIRLLPSDRHSKLLSKSKMVLSQPAVRPSILKIVHSNCGAGKTMDISKSFLFAFSIRKIVYFSLPLRFLHNKSPSTKSFFCKFLIRFVSFLRIFCTILVIKELGNQSTDDYFLLAKDPPNN